MGHHVTAHEVGPLLRQAELPPIRFHDLRHAFATLQLAAGTDPKIVSEVFGHKDVAITLDRYSHAMPTMQVEAMGRLDAILGRAPLDGPDVAEEAGWHRNCGSTRTEIGGRHPRRRAIRVRIRVRRSGAGHEEARSELRSGRRWRIWYRIPDSNR